MSLLDAAERAFFATHGWLVVRAAVSAERVAELARAVDEIVPESAYGSGALWEIPGVSRGSAVIARHSHDSTMAERVGELFDCARVKLLQDTLLVKPPQCRQRVEWHQDHTYTGYLEPARMATVRLALAECSVQSGCMNVLDKSHLWGLIGDVRALSAASVSDALHLLPGDREAKVRAATRAVELQPGDLSIHHCLTFHGSLENRSPRARKTLITRLFDADCVLVPARLPSAAAAAHFPTDGAGHLADTAFPVLYARR